MNKLFGYYIETLLVCKSTNDFYFKSKRIVNSSSGLFIRKKLKDTIT